MMTRAPILLEKKYGRKEEWMSRTLWIIPVACAVVGFKQGGLTIAMLLSEMISFFSDDPEFIRACATFGIAVSVGWYGMIFQRKGLFEELTRGSYPTVSMRHVRLGDALVHIVFPLIAIWRDRKARTATLNPSLSILAGLVLWNRVACGGGVSLLPADSVYPLRSGGKIPAYMWHRAYTIFIFVCAMRAVKWDSEIVLAALRRFMKKDPTKYNL